MFFGILILFVFKIVGVKLGRLIRFLMIWFFEIFGLEIVKEM